MSDYVTTGEDADGDEASIQCPCGASLYFDLVPEEHDRLECDCGRVLVIQSVSWSAYVDATVERKKEAP